MDDDNRLNSACDQLRDSLRFSVSPNENGLCFDWLHVEGLPDSRRVNEALERYFPGRAVRDVDPVVVNEILNHVAGPIAPALTQIVREYCQYFGGQ